MFRKKKLRKTYDQKLLELMTATKDDWQYQQQFAELSYEQSEELRCQTLLAKAKYFFLFQEARNRKVTLRR